MWKVAINVQCENCDHEYSFNRQTQLPIAGRKVTRPSDLREGYPESTTSVVYDYPKEFPPDSHLFIPVPCPQCGYYQSWMLDQAKKGKRAQWILVRASPFFAPSLLICLTGALFPKLFEGSWIPAALMTGLLFLGFLGACVVVAVAYSKRFSVRWDPNKGVRASVRRRPKKEWVPY
jgi:hypothetical protein